MPTIIKGLCQQTSLTRLILGGKPCIRTSEISIQTVINQMHKSNSLSQPTITQTFKCLTHLIRDSRVVCMEEEKIAQTIIRIDRLNRALMTVGMNRIIIKWCILMHTPKRMKIWTVVTMRMLMKNTFYMATISKSMKQRMGLRILEKQMKTRLAWAISIQTLRNSLYLRSIQLWVKEIWIQLQAKKRLQERQRLVPNTLSLCQYLYKPSPKMNWFQHLQTRLW